MARVIQLPDGATAEFPDDMSDTDIESVLQKQFGSPQPAPETPAPKVRKPVGGIGEAALNIGTGMAASAIGGVRALPDIAEVIGGLISGRPTEEAVARGSKKIADTQQALTYQPRSYEGQTIAHMAGLPLEWAGKGFEWVGGHVGQAIGGDKGRLIGESIGKVSPEVAATLMLGSGALKAAPKISAGADRLVRDIRQGALERSITPEKVARSGNDAIHIDAANTALRNDITLDPYDSNPSIRNAVGTVLADRPTMHKMMVTENRPKINRIARKDLGIPDGTPLSKETFSALREEAAKPYAEIRQIPEFTADAKYLSDIRNLNSMEGMTEQGRAAVKDPHIQDLINKTDQPSWNGHDVVTLMSEYRRLASEALNPAKNNGVVSEASGRAYKKAAQAIEGLVDRRLMEMEKQSPGQGFGDLANRFVEGRKTIAKSHVYDKNTFAGDVDAVALGKVQNRGGAFTGGLKDIADMGASFPEVLRPTESTGALARTTLRYGLPGVIATSVFGTPVAGMIAAGSVPAASIMLRRHIASPAYQAKHAVPPDFRPMVERPGFQGPIRGANDVPSQPLSLAPLGEDIPRQTVPDGQVPYRGLLSLADDQPVSRSSPRGGAVDFPLRQEMLQQLSPEIEAFIKESDRLQGILTNKYIIDQGVKEKALGALTALQDEFAAGMRMMGVDNAAEAHGALRRLYQAGEGTKLPVVKTKSLNDTPFVGPSVSRIPEFKPASRSEMLKNLQDD